MGGFVPGSNPVTYSPLPKCCQLVNQGNCFLLNFNATAIPIAPLCKPHIHMPILSAVMSTNTTSSPLPLCASSGAEHFRKLLFLLKILLLPSLYRGCHSPFQIMSAPSSARGHPKLK